MKGVVNIFELLLLLEEGSDCKEFYVRCFRQISHLDAEEASRMDFPYFWLLTSTLMLIHQHQASTFSVTSPTAEEGPVEQLPHTAHRREKRCSCENQKDKECIFFCHIGIVWVNTPSHVVPYGFGPVRLRRELGRCLCTDARDAECLSFCSVQTPAE